MWSSGIWYKQWPAVTTETCAYRGISILAPFVMKFRTWTRRYVEKSERGRRQAGLVRLRQLCHSMYHAGTGHALFVHQFDFVWKDIKNTEIHCSNTFVWHANYIFWKYIKSFCLIFTVSNLVSQCNLHLHYITLLSNAASGGKNSVIFIRKEK